jgi:hypothetical protein
VIRTHEAGTLREEHAGTTVTLTGWVARRRDHGGVAFLDLRDGSGIAQVVVRENDIAHDLRAEYCVRVVGEVRVRPEGNRNEALPTGAVEVAASEVEVLSASAPLPFPLDDDIAVGDEVRLKYRYLDLRRASSAAALRTRSLITRSIRRVMDERDFLDIETPTLTRSTPEGARDFLVPVRLQPGSWYALPQSPQLFKQLLMVAGMERYYQIARCYRDEDFRADRQPEFTQLDIEMSFPDEEDLYELTEAVMTRIWRRSWARDPGAVPADDLRRGDAPLRRGPAGRPLRGRAGRPDLLLRRDAVPGVPVRPRRGCRHAGRRHPAAQGLRRLAGVRQAARLPRAGLRHLPGGRHARRAGRQEPVRVRARGPAEAVGRRSATAPSSPPERAPRRWHCSAPPGSRSAAGSACWTTPAGSSSG